jgi:5'-deoxynucleotidase YfbR-like HD superfamily hydrolase
MNLGLKHKVICKYHYFKEDEVMQETKRKGDYIGTYTGKQFWPLDPKPEDVTLMDIAYALSNICRFNGHTKRFYSVAEHSLNVEKFLRDRHASPSTILYGLLHDAAEAYVCDIPRPLKRFLSDYKNIETEVIQAIYKAFNLEEPDYFQKKIIKSADNYMLAVEARELMIATEAWALEKIDPNACLPEWNDVSATFMAEVNVLLSEVKKQQYSSF